MPSRTVATSTIPVSFVNRPATRKRFGEPRNDWRQFAVTCAIPFPERFLRLVERLYPESGIGLEQVERLQCAALLIDSMGVWDDPASRQASLLVHNGRATSGTIGIRVLRQVTRGRRGHPGKTALVSPLRRPRDGTRWPKFRRPSERPDHRPD